MSTGAGHYVVAEAALDEAAAVSREMSGLYLRFANEVITDEMRAALLEAHQTEMSLLACGQVHATLALAAATAEFAMADIRDPDAQAWSEALS